MGNISKLADLASGLGSGTPLLENLSIDLPLTIKDGATQYGSLFMSSSALDLQANNNSTAGLRLGSTIAQPVVIYTNGTERVRVDNNGNLLIGRTASSALPSATGCIQIPDNIANGSIVIGGFGSFIGRNSADGSTVINTGQAGIVFSAGTYGASTELLRISSNGNVGVGVVTANSRIQVDGRVFSSSSFTSTGGDTDFNATGARAFLDYVGMARIGTVKGGTLTNSPVAFYVDSVERMRIDTAGNVGIGTSSPGSALQITRSGNVTMMLQSSTGAACRLGLDSTGLSYSWLEGSQNVLRFACADTERLRITTQDIQTYLPINPAGGFVNARTVELTGNYSANTWYSLASAADLIDGALYIIFAFTDTYAVGGGHYTIVSTSVPFFWHQTGTNGSDMVSNFPSPVFMGHAPNNAYLSFRTRMPPSSVGSILEFSTSAAWSGLDNATSGKVARFYFKRIG